MKTNIYYFSGTGNSLKVALDLAAELENDENTVKIIPIVKAMEEELDLACDRIGVVSPVYMWGLPKIVNRFLGKLKTDKYVFVIATNAGSIAGTLIEARKLLASHGTELSAGFSLVMPSNYTPFGGAPPERRQQELFFLATKRIKEIAGIVREEKKGILEKGFILKNIIMTGFVRRMSLPQIPKICQNFLADDKCVGCGTCVKVCPVDNIELVNDRPKWQDNCELCYACLQWCPKEAIQYKNKTQDKRRYHHPDIKAADIMKQKG